MHHYSKVDGIIVSNTTVARPPAVAAHPHGAEMGGLSGAPLMESSTAVLSEMYRLTKGRIPLIGCGGVSDGKDAYRKIRAGASLVQMYTAFAYQVRACRLLVSKPVLSARLVSALETKM